MTQVIGNVHYANPHPDRNKHQVQNGRNKNIFGHAMAYYHYSHLNERVLYKADL